MNPWIFLLLVIVAIALALWIPRFRLRQVMKQPFPDEWVEILERNIGIYKNLPMPLRLQLRQKIKLFLHRKHFSGAGGLEVTDEMRVTIAAQACMLQINRRGPIYPRLKYIILYPTAFIVSRMETNESGVSGHAARGLLGESWDNGKVILAWDNVLHGARNFVDGQNVTLHEFSHQLDSESGNTNGAPILAGESSYRSWASILSGEFRVLRKKARRGSRSLMDHYGATNPAEFFAVATETFFEKPEKMARHHAELFKVLRDYYRVDPRNWKAAER
ncbi:MAG: zinc-dependent peptidase [Xanthomonadales bacterium]|nr:zinc-dependent peptidase [Gammaproteobacteria bacterium]MBT8051664.1 zinc-dependent peptidase [Gammaproteobacteria bacterium]MBT8055996.1 zinc-dependent peptidase [Gammaproteobacteria bacterium]NNJ79834.1 zinc-dependent peptidase [Xanthomonadales bacterium]NNL05278.1 zinc-dependent peptidase [Xanthomonadales bacterium]